MALIIPITPEDSQRAYVRATMVRNNKDGGLWP